MVKAIEVFGDNNFAGKNDYFRVLTTWGKWNYASYAYLKDAKYPVVVYGHSSYRKNSTPGIYKRRIKYCTIFVIVEVGFNFIFDDIMYYPSKGDIVIIKDNEEFATYYKDKCYDHYYEIDFPLIFFEHVDEDSIFSKLFYDKSNGSPNIISTNASTCDLLVQKFNETEKVALSDSENKDFLVWSYIIQIIDLIYSQRSGSKSYLNAQNIPPKLKEAIEYININFVNLKNIDEIAEHCQITSTYLARMFKKILETTPNEYVTNLKIAYSKHLLALGKSITDVCYESGFNNYTYFISKFKAITGTTPSKYQKKHST